MLGVRQTKDAEKKGRRESHDSEGVMMNRTEHLDWCKQRALEYVDQDDMQNAFSSMISDLGKHEKTAGHPATAMMSQLFFNGHLNDAAKMREYIEGFE